MPRIKYTYWALFSKESVENRKKEDVRLVTFHNKFVHRDPVSTEDGHCYEKVSLGTLLHACHVGYTRAAKLIS